MKLLNKIALLSLCIVFFSFVKMNAQGVINAEQYLNSDDSLIVAANFTYSGTRGNAISDEIKISPTFLLKAKQNQYKLFGEYQTASGGGNTFLNSGFVHFRHNYNINTKLKTFAFAQIQFNEVLLLEQRSVIGGGLRIGLIARDSLKSSLGLGLMKEYELLNATVLPVGEVLETDFIRTAIVHSLSYTLKHITISNVLYYQAHVSNFDDIRLLSETMLNMEVNTHFDFIIEHSIRYDSQAPSILVNADHQFQFGLNYHF